MASSSTQVTTAIAANNTASLTAVTVSGALSRCAHDEKYAHLFPEHERALARHFFLMGKSALGFGNYLLFSMVDGLWHSAQRAIVDSATVRGLDELILLRKLLIKNRIHTAIQNGVEQVVFLGGGYDIRGLLTAMSHPSVAIYEIDIGETRKQKTKAIRRIPPGIGLGEFTVAREADGTVIVNKNLSLIECDLRTADLFQVLQKHGYDKAEKTLIIAEGLTMYLTEAENQALLQSLSANMSENDEFLLSFITRITYSALADTAMKGAKESYKFSIAIDQLSPFLHACGFDMSGKFFTRFMLDKIGATDILAHLETHPDTPEEHYFSLIKSQAPAPIPINDVPRLEFELPPKTEKPECVIQ